jgi:creatinine amidohydrolase
MKHTVWPSLFSVLLLGLLATDSASLAQQRGNDDERERRAQEMLSAENLLDEGDSLWIEDLTYLEVRDRIERGHTIAIVPTGGIEQNGPYLVTGKHNVMLEPLCPEIARQLGNALCAPIVPFVPEGDIDPPSGHMRYPGTISVRDSTFHALLDDIASSLKQHGFRHIVLIGDSGGNQRGLAAIVDELSARWKDSGTHAHYIQDFYDPGWMDTLQYAREELGVVEPHNDGHHDDIYVTAVMMVADPASVRYEQRVAADLATINGVDITPAEETIEIGRKLVVNRARITVDAIKSAIAASE